MFAQASTTTTHLSSSGLSRMVHEYLLRCFILKDPSLGFLKLFQVACIACGVIFRSVALLLGVNKLLAMAKDTGGLHLIAISEVVLQLIIRSIVLQL